MGVTPPVQLVVGCGWEEGKAVMHVVLPPDVPLSLVGVVTPRALEFYSLL
jgi:hypothetical protein